MILFLAGILVGATFGLFVTALMVAGKENEGEADGKH